MVDQNEGSVSSEKVGSVCAEFTISLEVDVSSEDFCSFPHDAIIMASEIIEMKVMILFML
jgi:hypothetical protein